MKTIVKGLIIFSLLGLYFPSVRAQDDLNGMYKSSPELDKYIGTWQWVSGDSSLIITLIKTQFNLKKSDPNAPNATIDVIIGWHEFKLKDRVVESSKANKSNEYDYKNHNFTIHAICLAKEGFCDRLTIDSFRDINAMRKRVGYLKIKENEPNLAELVLHEEMWFEKTPRPKRTFPNRFILKRIK